MASLFTNTLRTASSGSYIRSCSSTTLSPVMLARTFSTCQPALKLSNRARGAKRKSLRNLAILAEISPKYAFKAHSKTKKRSNLDEESNLDAFTLEQACEKLQGREAVRRPLNAFEVHIVTTVSHNLTNAFRGRIVYPKDPRTKQEKLLIFAEEGSNVHETVKAILEKEKANSSQTSPPPPAEAAAAPESTTEVSEPVNNYEPSIILGGSDLIDSVVNNRVTEFSKVLCSTNLVPQVSKNLARSLGPKGLMPNPRRGTVVASEDSNAIINAIKEARGAVDWRSDKAGVVRGAIGRLNFDKADVRKNVTALIDAIIEKVPTLGLQSTPGVQLKEWAERANRSPAELKKAATIIRQIHLSSTQGAGVKLDLRDVLL